MTKVSIRFLVLSAVFSWCFSGYAQSVYQKHAFGVYQNLTDYNVSLLNNKVFSFDSAVSQSFRIAYQRRLSPSWSLNTGLNNGIILNQQLKENFVKKAYSVGLDAAIMFKLNNGRLIKEDALVGPFLSFGYRSDYVPILKREYNESPWLAHNQYGVGLNLRLAPRTHLQLHSMIDQKLQGDFNTHMLYRLGFTQSLGIYELEKPKVSPKLDSDKDGIVDIKDECPGRFGLKANKGCPDTLVYAQNKIAIDSLALLAQEQKAEIDKLELINAELRNGKELPGRGSIDSAALVAKQREYELRIAVLRDEINRLKDKPTSIRVDTVYKERVIYKDVELDSSALLAQQKAEKDRQAALEKARLAEEQLRREKERLARLEREAEELRRQEKELLDKERSKAENDTPSIEDGPVKVDPEIPADKNYYVITISSPNISTAQSWLIKMKKDFKDARILPQPNGYYRVGVFAAKDKAYGLKVLEQVKAKGYSQVWLSVE